MNDSPFLIRCKGCEKNIGKHNLGKEECLIYIKSNNESRLIKKRTEKGLGLKPYEILQIIIYKNNKIKEIIEEEQQNEIYNEKIDMINNSIVGTEKLLNFIKNCIQEKRDNSSDKRIYYIYIRCTKIKKKY